MNTQVAEYGVNCYAFVIQSDVFNPLRALFPTTPKLPFPLFTIKTMGWESCDLRKKKEENAPKKKGICFFYTDYLGAGYNCTTIWQTVTQAWR